MCALDLTLPEVLDGLSQEEDSEDGEDSDVDSDVDSDSEEEKSKESETEEEESSDVEEEEKSRDWADQVYCSLWKTSSPESSGSPDRRKQ